MRSFYSNFQRINVPITNIQPSIRMTDSRFNRNKKFPTKLGQLNLHKRRYHLVQSDWKLNPVNQINTPKLSSTAITYHNTGGFNQWNNAEFYQKHNDTQKSKLRRFNSIEIQQASSSNEAMIEWFQNTETKPWYYGLDRRLRKLCWKYLHPRRQLSWWASSRGNQDC